MGVEVRCEVRDVARCADARDEAECGEVARGDDARGGLGAWAIPIYDGPTPAKRSRLVRNY